MWTVGFWEEFFRIEKFCLKFIDFPPLRSRGSCANWKDENF